MASANQRALDEGRITQAQFDSMAAYKFTCYGNWEDLDVDRDYTKYGIVKWYPVIGFDTKDGREVVSPKGFAKYMMDKLGITDYDLDDVDDDPGVTGVSLVYRGLGWTWINDYDYPTDKMDTMIKYTFGGWCNREMPLAKYCCGYHQMYE